MSFENKLIAIINKDIDVGVALNAVAHATIGLGSDVSQDLLRLDTYIDKDNNEYPNISQIPFIMLRGKSNDIRKVIQTSRSEGLKIGIFTNTMTIGTYQEQLERTSQTAESELIYYAVVIFGPWDLVSHMTKRLSLYR